MGVWVGAMWGLLGIHFTKVQEQWKGAGIGGVLEGNLPLRKKSHTQSCDTGAYSIMLQIKP